MIFALKNWKKLTPKKWKKLGNALMGFGAGFAGISVYADHEYIAITSAIIGLIGKFITELTCEES